jgi:hypothetical protein
MTWGPALNVLVSSFTLSPSFCWKMPPSTPTIAEACVTLGK